MQAGVGIDAGAYARVLMHNASRIADEQASSNVMSCSDRDECEALAFGGKRSRGLHWWWWEAAPDVGGDLELDQKRMQGAAWCLVSVKQ